MSGEIAFHKERKRSIVREDSDGASSMRSIPLKRARNRIREEPKLFVMAGTNIYLPKSIDPYPSQKLMMFRIIQSLKMTSTLDFTQHNALIESPTGSGKTLALLSSSCAWLREYKKLRAESRTKCHKHNKRGTKKISAAKKVDCTVVADDEASSNDSARENVPPKAANKKLNKFNDSLESLIIYDDETEDGEVTILNDDDELNEPSSSLEKCTCLPIVRIYYGTRTHKQISQVVKEFGRLQYDTTFPLKHTILGSRDQTCINHQVREGDPLQNVSNFFEKKTNITARCQELLIDRIGCMHRNELRKIDTLKLRSIVERSAGNAWDLEDIVQALDDVRPTPLCPYFASTRSLTIDSDIIFCPFNYLLDPIIRNSSDVNLPNSVVILDEAHNVEDTCRDSASFDFEEEELHQAIGSVAQKIAELKHQMNRPNAADQNQSVTEVCDDGGEQEADSGKESILEEYLDALQAANDFLLKFLDFTKNFANSAFGKKSFGGNEQEYTYTFNWEPLLEELGGKEDEEASLLLPQPSSGYKQLARALYVLEGKLSAGRERNSGQEQVDTEDLSSGVSRDQVIGKFKPSSAAFSCIQKFLCFSQYFNEDENYKFYKCNIKMTKTRDYTPLISQRKVGGIGNKASKTQHFNTQFRTPWLVPRDSSVQCEHIQPGFETTIAFWCMLPCVAFKDAFKQTRSVILASGTLCPTETLRTELGVEFQAQMEGNQVISKDQIFACALSQGPTGQKMIATYKNVFTGDEFMRELGRIVVSICQIVPGGVLCFLSSYNVMENLHSTLESQEFSSDLQSKKRVFKEPRRNSELQAILDEYDSAIQNPYQYGTKCNGALMLAVFRGKVSEGIDFADNKARCVICVGIPYPSTKDEIIIQKKNFNDECRRTMKQYKNIPSGDEWYMTQAYRALNQALGRCLRHKNDWGALILVDERFVFRAKTPEGKKISRWVRNELGHYNNANGFFSFQRDLENFIEQMKERFHC